MPRISPSPRVPWKTTSELRTSLIRASSPVEKISVNLREISLFAADISSLLLVPRRMPGVELDPVGGPCSRPSHLSGIFPASARMVVLAPVAGDLGTGRHPHALP